MQWISDAPDGILPAFTSLDSNLYYLYSHVPSNDVQSDLMDNWK